MVDFSIKRKKTEDKIEKKQLYLKKSTEFVKVWCANRRYRHKQVTEYSNPKK